MMVATRDSRVIAIRDDASALKSAHAAAHNWKPAPRRQPARRARTATGAAIQFASIQTMRPIGLQRPLVSPSSDRTPNSFERTNIVWRKWALGAADILERRESRARSASIGNVPKWRASIDFE